jgi:hypothetical protein
MRSKPVRKLVVEFAMAEKVVFDKHWSTKEQKELIAVVGSAKFFNGWRAL